MGEYIMDIVTLAASRKYTDKKIMESAVVGIKYEIVDSLPSSGEAQTIYFVKSDNSLINNYYDEYVWISTSNAFEKIGSTQIDDFIPNPSTAKIGQTIVVKEVDENGKPTKWEAADIAGNLDQNTMQIINISDEVIDGNFDFISRGQGLYFSNNNITFKFLHWDKNHENYTTATAACSGLFIVSYTSDNGWTINTLSGSTFVQFSDTPIIDGYYDEAYVSLVEVL